MRFITSLSSSSSSISLAIEALLPTCERETGAKKSDHDFGQSLFSSHREKPFLIGKRVCVALVVTSAVFNNLIS